MVEEGEQKMQQKKKKQREEKESVTLGKLGKIGKGLIRKIVRQPRKTKGGGRHASQEKRIVRN